MAVRVLVGDCRATLRDVETGSVQCVVTSPPYLGLRDYGVAGQIGLEATPDEYVAALVGVFREIRRVLREDGVVWLNLGDSYANTSGLQDPYRRTTSGKLMPPQGRAPAVAGIRPKNLLGVPWRVAFALQADGWILRQDIIWSKANCMPESVQDRCTRSHEYIFMLTKQERYFYDAQAIAEPVARGDAGSTFTSGKTGVNGQGRVSMASRRGSAPSDKQAEVGKRTYTGFNARWDASEAAEPATTRNKRSVWHVNTQPFAEAHYAVFPEKLIEPCILAGTSERGACAACGAPYRRVVERVRLAPAAPSGNREIRRWDVRDTSSLGGRPATQAAGWEPSCTCGTTETRPCLVLDPFGGSGTVGRVATKHRRDAILCELNEDYCRLIEKRLEGVPVTLPFDGVADGAAEAV